MRKHSEQRAKGSYVSKLILQTVHVYPRRPRHHAFHASVSQSSIVHSKPLRRHNPTLYLRLPCAVQVISYIPLVTCMALYTVSLSILLTDRFAAFSKYGSGVRKQCLR